TTAPTTGLLFVPFRSLSAPATSYLPLVATRPPTILPFPQGNVDHPDPHSFPTRRSSDLPPELPNTTLPLPPKVWLPLKFTLPYRSLDQISKHHSPANTICCSTLRHAPLFARPTSISPLTVTPSNVELPNISSAPQLRQSN